MPWPAAGLRARGACTELRAAVAGRAVAALLRKEKKADEKKLALLSQKLQVRSSGLALGSVAFGFMFRF